MGCWNGTCGITNLPILHGMPVRLILLVESGKNYGGTSGHCYPADLWTPYSLPILGKYNDYGWIEEIKENDTSLITLELVKTGLVPFKKSKKDSGRDVEINSDKCSSFDVIGEWLHSGKLEAKCSYEKPKLKMASMFILEEVYQFLLSTNTEEFRSDRVFTIKSQFKSYYDLLLKSEDINYRENEGMDAWLKVRREQDTHPVDALFSARSESLQTFSNGGLRAYGQYVRDMAFQKEPFDAVENVLNDMYGLYVLNYQMCNLRKTFSPQSGAGSQDKCLELHNLLIQKMSDLTETIGKWYADDEFDEDDED